MPKIALTANTPKVLYTPSNDGTTWIMIQAPAAVDLKLWRNGPTTDTTTAFTLAAGQKIVFEDSTKARHSIYQITGQTASGADVVVEKG